MKTNNHHILFYKIRENQTIHFIKNIMLLLNNDPNDKSH